MRRSKVTVTRWGNRPVIVYRDLSGKRCVRKFDSEREAYKEAEKVEAQLQSGVMADEYLTVREYVEKFLKGVEAKVATGRASKAHLHNCHYILGKHLVNVEGNRKFIHLTRPVIRDFLNRGLTEGYAQASVSTALAVISSMFADAVDMGVIAHNPCRGLARTMGLTPAVGKAMTLEQAGKFLRYVKEKEPEFDLPFSLYLKTGMRLGEGLALRREDFDFDARKLSVRGNATKFGDVTSPKTDLSLRDVEIPEDLALEIRESLSSRATPFILMADWPAKPSPRQIRAARDRITRAMKRITTAIGLYEFTTHSLRHTFATLHLNAGAEMLWVSRQMGHASITTTVNRYGKGASPRHPEYQDAMSEILSESARKAKFRVATIRA